MSIVLDSWREQRENPSGSSRRDRQIDSVTLQERSRSTAFKCLDASLQLQTRVSLLVLLFHRCNRSLRLPLSFSILQPAGPHRSIGRLVGRLVVITTAMAKKRWRAERTFVLRRWSWCSCWTADSAGPRTRGRKSKRGGHAGRGRGSFLTDQTRQCLEWRSAFFLFLFFSLPKENETIRASSNFPRNRQPRK